MTILDFIRSQGRAVLPMEVHEAFPHRTSKQICDSLDDYVIRGKLERIPIPNTTRRYRYKIATPKRIVVEHWSMSEVKPELLNLVRIP